MRKANEKKDSSVPLVSCCTEVHFSSVSFIGVKRVRLLGVCISEGSRQGDDPACGRGPLASIHGVTRGRSTHSAVLTQSEGTEETAQHRKCSVQEKRGSVPESHHCPWSVRWPSNWPGWPASCTTCRCRQASRLSSSSEYPLVEWCFTSTETVGLLGTGAQDVHLDFHTAPELYVILHE